MFRSFLRGATHQASINGQSITVDPGETVLQAALRQNIPFPNVCRVGGCGACKCKLADGRVREMTETGYLLTEQEIGEGYILACQSAPKTDITVEVDLEAALAGNIVRGRVTAQTPLTHDIARIDIQLDEKLDYRAGQYAALSIASLPGTSRSYSFATPPSADNKVSFMVRRVPGGRFSTRLVDDQLVGEEVQLHGPGGAFWLRPGTAPVIMVAGGSGLAPILAMLTQAKRAGDTRPVTLLFGAREERDLYALDELRALSENWPDFKFVPVLSAVQPGSSWSGARGLVTDFIDTHRAGADTAYLCGPPPMVDAAAARLATLGLPGSAIFADRFVTGIADETGFSGGVVAAERTPTRLFDYLKYFMMHAVGLTATFGMILGGTTLPIGLAVVFTYYVIGDALSGDDTTVPNFTRPGLLTAQLWLTLPLLAALVFASVWAICPGDPLSLGALVEKATGYNALAARAADTWVDHAAAFITTFLLIGMIGTITAHELTHRTWDPISMLIGRLLLAFSIDTSFAIEHVYGHHRYVSTTHDPATAPRGRNVYFHMLASTWSGNISAWKIEAERLRRKHLPVFSHHNAYLRGQAMSLALVLIAFAMGGWVATAYFLSVALLGKSLLEIVNYMEHYGMIRVPGQPVQPRHSWNTNKRVSSWSMFNLTRHSHHHAQGEVPYQDLMPFPDAPMMIGGYLTTMLATLVPPLWHRLMTPKVIAWDRDYASPAERALAREANIRSGIRAFESLNALDWANPAE